MLPIYMALPVDRHRSWDPRSEPTARPSTPPSHSHQPRATDLSAVQHIDLECRRNGHGTLRGWRTAPAKGLGSERQRACAQRACAQRLGTERQRHRTRSHSSPCRSTRPWHLPSAVGLGPDRSARQHSIAHCTHAHAARRACFRLAHTCSAYSSAAHRSSPDKNRSSRLQEHARDHAHRSGRPPSVSETHSCRVLHRQLPEGARRSHACRSMPLDRQVDLPSARSR